MRTLYLHAGLPKTGTTYIQTLLARNRDLLADEGIGLGPHFDTGTGSHRALFTTVFAETGVKPILTETAAGPGETLLVSFEGIELLMQQPSPQGGGRLMAHDFIEVARGLVHLRLVIFVRRQDFLAESNFSQAVKTWYRGGIETFDGYIQDLDQRLRPLEEIFGRENVIVRIFPDDADKANRRDIVADLFEAMGSDVAGRLERGVGAQNVSMHRRKIQFLSQVPKNPKARNSHRSSELPRLFTRVVEETSAIADEGGRFMMSPRDRHALVARHQAGNRALAARHDLAGADHFTALPDPDAPWSPPRPITAQECRAVFREALRAAWGRRNLLAALSQSAGISMAFAQMRSQEG